MIPSCRCDVIKDTARFVYPYNNRLDKEVYKSYFSVHLESSSGYLVSVFGLLMNLFLYVFIYIVVLRLRVKNRHLSSFQSISVFLNIFYATIVIEHYFICISLIDALPIIIILHIIHLGATNFF